MEEASPETRARKKRFNRVRVLHEELDRLMLDAEQRVSGISNKASFLAVSAGVLVAAATARVWEAVPVLGAVTLALACIALGCAAVALRPGKRPGVTARRLVDRHLDCDHNMGEVEEELVRDKATVLTAIEADIAARGRWVWAGFGALAVAAAALSVVFSIEILGR